MDKLTVSGAFMITIGYGEGPEVNVSIGVSADDGSPVHLDADDLPIEIFTTLTAMFGTSAFPCVITDVQSTFIPPAGFYGFRIQLTWEKELGRLNTLGLGALGVIVDTGTARGQAVIGPVGAATAQTWWADRQPEAPKR